MIGKRGIILVALIAIIITSFWLSSRYPALDEKAIMAGGAGAFCHPGAAPESDQQPQSARLSDPQPAAAAEWDADPADPAAEQPEPTAAEPVPAAAPGDAHPAGQSAAEHPARPARRPDAAEQ